MLPWHPSFVRARLRYHMEIVYESICQIFSLFMSETKGSQDRMTVLNSVHEEAALVCSIHVLTPGLPVRD